VRITASGAAKVVPPQRGRGPRRQRQLHRQQAFVKPPDMTRDASTLDQNNAPH
jgi:hypothetical protein